ncbi:MAG: flagellar hook-associated protein FlgL [Deltaproteobacteria bacterium]|nr:flagellar hook-associated protein FlgL [Deltaproteobacteria bacterium]
MRITQNIIYQTYINDIMRRQEDLFKLNLQLSTGKKLNAPSDDPALTSKVINSKSLLTDIDQYQRNIDLGLDYLSTVEQTLDSAKGVLSSIQEMAVTEATGTADADSRKGAALNITNSFNQLVDLANTHDANQYILSGYKTDTPAFTTAGVFQGDANKFGIKISSGTTVTIGINGGEVFSGSAGGIDVFQTIQTLINDLNANNAAGIKTAITDLDTSFKQISNAVSDIGGKVNWLKNSRTEYDSSKLDLQTQISGYEDADITKVISELQLGQTALQAAMTSAGKTFNVNIFDYL